MDVNNTLEAFCAKCILLGLRNVVITTGKGGGVVKNATLTWLKSNPKYVVGFFEIMDARGESGAIGVHLRRM
jgi:DNA-nicking Smr family endonuclease